MKALLVVACLGFASVASASVITYTDLASFQQAADPANHRSFALDATPIITTPDVTIDGITYSISVCSTKGTPSCWTDDSGLMANAITTQTYTWGAGNALTSLAFGYGTHGFLASYLVTATEIDDTVTQFVYTMLGQASPFLGVTSSIGLRSLVVADDPSDTFANNFSIADVWRSDIVPQGSPEPASLALLGLGAVVLSRQRRRHVP